MSDPSIPGTPDFSKIQKGTRRGRQTVFKSEYDVLNKKVSGLENDIEALKKDVEKLVKASAPRKAPAKKAPVKK